MAAKYIWAALALSLMVLPACASYPTSSVVQGTADGSLWFSNAPSGSTVRVDGMEAGSAPSFDGRIAVLAVAPGRHLVEVLVSGEPILRQTVVVASGSRFEVRVR